MKAKLATIIKLIENWTHIHDYAKCLKALIRLGGFTRVWLCTYEHLVIESNYFCMN